jgi:hypothetical protein
MDAVLEPFPNIANHVVETERIGGERTDRSRLAVIPLAAAASVNRWTGHCGGRDFPGDSKAEQGAILVFELFLMMQ